MATTLYFHWNSSNPLQDWQSGRNDANLQGSNVAWSHGSITTSRGSGAQTISLSGSFGPVNGLEPSPGVGWVDYISAPLSADVTISGSITSNICGYESHMNGNAGPRVTIERINSEGTYASTVLNDADGVEWDTSESAHNWPQTPTSTNFLRGDRIRIRLSHDDAGGTMAPHTFTFVIDGTSGGGSGDTYVTFTETFSFEAEPSGTTVYLTTTSAGINPGSANEYEAWTSRGSGSTDAITNTAAGWTAPIQCTETGGGTALEWYTKQLTAFTLGGAVRCNVRAKESASTANIGVRCEIAVCNGDGTGAVVWGATTGFVRLTTTDAALSFLVSGDDTSVTSGQRLRIRLLIDDGLQNSGSSASPMAASQTCTVTYAGTSGAAAGDTYLTFAQTLSQASSALALPINRQTFRFRALVGR